MDWQRRQKPKRCQRWGVWCKSCLHMFFSVVSGDGWSARYEDSMTHGCVPVIIMDNTLGPFESLIDYSKFTIR